MGKKILVNMGELAVGHEGDTIETGGIGSCVVITLYDAEAKVGAMAHAMLPTAKNGIGKDMTEPVRISIDSDKIFAKYVDDSIDTMVAEIENSGGKKERLKAKIVGGARMFKILSGDKFGIGFQNSEMAKKHLGEIGIHLESEDVGGTVGRSAKLQVDNGLLSVSTVM